MIKYLIAASFAAFVFPAKTIKTEVRAVASHQINKLKKSPAWRAPIAEPASDGAGGIQMFLNGVLS